MRSEDVHKALLQGATRFELCKLVIRGVRDSAKDGLSTPRECIGSILQELAANPAAVTEFRISCAHPGPLKVITHATT